MTNNEKYLILAKNPEKNKRDLRKMVGDAARSKGYNIGPVYHGGDPSHSIMSFDPSLSKTGIIWFTDSSKYAKFTSIDKFEQETHKVYPAYLKIENPLDIRGRKDEEIWNRIRDDKEYVDDIRKQGYDGIILNDVNAGIAGTSYVVFNSNQAKSAELVTYKGKDVIPLSDRFNSSSIDIRESIFISLTPEQVGEREEEWKKTADFDTAIENNWYDRVKEIVNDKNFHISILELLTQIKLTRHDGKEKIVKILIPVLEKIKSNAHIKDAVKYGWYDRVREIIDSGEMKEYYTEAFIDAVYNGTPTIVKLLFPVSDINQLNYKEMEMAIRILSGYEGTKDMVKLLFDKITMKESIFTPVSQDQEMERYLYYAKWNNPTELMLDAIRKNNFRQLKLLVENGFDVNCHDMMGYTPLIVAIVFERYDMAKYLIEHDADVNMATKAGNDALYEAIKIQNADMVEYLLQHGASTALTYRYGGTPFTFAGGWGYKNNAILDLLNKYSRKVDENTVSFDERYMELAEDPEKNEAELQNLVYDAAMKAGYTVKAYHGTRGFTGNRFNGKFSAQGVFWFSEDRDKIARGESGASGRNSIMEVYLKTGKVAGWPEYEKLMLCQIENDGYASIHLDDDWVIFDEKNIKSAELVTYKNRKIVPLSNRFNSLTADIRESIGSYKDDEKYHQIIPEIKYIDPMLLKMKNGYEVSKVSREVAGQMKFNEPVEVSLFRDGELIINDGHHRVAAAKQLGMKKIPVVLQAINAFGRNINVLINSQENKLNEVTSSEDQKYMELANKYINGDKSVEPVLKEIILKTAKDAEAGVPQTQYVERYDSAVKGRVVVEIVKNPDRHDIAKIKKEQSYGEEIGAIVTRVNSYAFRRDMEFHKNVANKIGVHEYVGVLLGDDYAEITDATSNVLRTKEAKEMVRRAFPWVREFTYFDEAVVGSWNRVKPELIASDYYGGILYLSKRFGRSESYFEESIFVPVSTSEASARKQKYKELTGYDIIDAVRHNDIDTVQKYIIRGRDLSVITSQGFTLLMMAAIRGFYTMSNILVGNGVGINRQDYDGQTALHFALNIGYGEKDIREKIIRLLLDNGADVNIRNNNGCDILMSAVINDLPADEIEMILNNGANMMTVDRNNNIPWMQAVTSSNIAIMKVLLDHGMDIDNQDSRGVTALIRSTVVKKNDVVEFLLEKGANPNIKTNMGFTAMDFAEGNIEDTYNSEAIIMLKSFGAENGKI